MTSAPTSSNEPRAAVLADRILLDTLGLMAGLYLAGVAALFCGLELSPYTGGGGVVLGFLLARLIPEVRRDWQATAITAALAAGALFVSGWFFDYSWDGLVIHKPAVAQFLDGWNPYLDGSSQKGVDFWTAVYPKASWICAAQLAALTGVLECGKAINLLAILAAGLAAWRFLRHRLPSRPRSAAAGAALLALNPVSVYQAPTFYIDGLLASLVTLLLFTLAHHLARPTTRPAWFEIAVPVVLVVNFKFTGLVYVCVIFAVAAAVVFHLHRVRTTVRFCGFAALTVLSAVLICGKTPYADNLLAGRHFFYPIMGREAVDIIDILKPANLAEHDRFSSFIIGNFSKSEPVRAPASTNPRLPFDLSGVMRSRNWCDIEAGGFGPLFAEAMLLAGLLGMVCIIGRKSWTGAAGVFVAAAAFASGFINPEAWWARYSPQLFILPVLVMLASSRSPSRVVRVAGASGLALLAANLMLVAYLSTIPKRGMSARWHETVGEMRQVARETGAPVAIDEDTPPIIGIELRAAGIPITEGADTDANPEGRRPINGVKDGFWQAGAAPAVPLAK